MEGNGSEMQSVGRMERKMKKEESAMQVLKGGGRWYKHQCLFPRNDHLRDSAPSAGQDRQPRLSARGRRSLDLATTGPSAWDGEGRFHC